MPNNNLKILANLVFNPCLIESSKIKPKLPINNLFNFLSNEYGIIIDDTTRLNTIKKLLQSKKHPINSKLSSGYIKFQKEVGITIEETKGEKVIHIIHLIASPSGQLQCMIEG